ncbi:MAG: methyltransferase domain-containing protein [Planctomycetales bacterium]
MNANELSLVEFYKLHEISPVSQDVSDLRKHFQRRQALYHHLGVAPAAVQGRKVLEIGPGSGHNSLFTASLGPSAYVLVEGNPQGVKDVGELFSHHPQWTDGLRVENALLEDFESDEKFDLVILEGALGLLGTQAPEEFLAQAARFTAPGGMLVITCVDAASQFAETTRRLFAQMLIHPDQSLEDKLRVLLPIFQPHLARLEGMSRPPSDWIVDNLINPAAVGKTFSIPDALESLSGEFTIWSSSPRFLTDWRWYKKIVGEDAGFNEAALRSYWSNLHSFLDHQRVLPPRDEAENVALLTACSEVRARVVEYERDRDEKHVAEIASLLGDVVRLTEAVHAELAEAFQEAKTLLEQRPIDRQGLAACNFGGLFGRGQQYLSFVRDRPLL